MTPRGRIAVGAALIAATALVPLLGGADEAVSIALQGVRAPLGQRVFALLSDVTRPLGFVLLALAAVVAWRRGGPRADVVQIVSAVAVGVVLLEALKDVVDRARPYEDVSVVVGQSFPSGHTGNVLLTGIAIGCLLALRGRRLGAPAIVAAVLVAAAIGCSRMYLDRHWLSDVVGSLALFGGYGVLALLDPDRRRRWIAVGAAATATVGLLLASVLGWRVPIPAGLHRELRVVRRVTFGEALARGALTGGWAPDTAETVRSTALLVAPSGSVAIDGVEARADELRVVARAVGRPQRLRLDLNGTRLGSAVLWPGWRTYTFRVPAGLLRPDRNVVRVEVGEHGVAAGSPLASFSDVTLYRRSRAGLHLDGVGERTEESEADVRLVQVVGGAASVARADHVDEGHAELGMVALDPRDAVDALLPFGDRRHQEAAVRSPVGVDALEAAEGARQLGVERPRAAHRLLEGGGGGDRMEVERGGVRVLPEAVDEQVLAPRDLHPGKEGVDRGLEQRQVVGRDGVGHVVPAVPGLHPPIPPDQIWRGAHRGSSSMGLGKACRVEGPCTRTRS